MRRKTRKGKGKKTSSQKTRLSLSFSISKLTHAVWRYKTATRGTSLMMLSSRRRRGSAAAPGRRGRRRHRRSTLLDFRSFFSLSCLQELSLFFSLASCAPRREREREGESSSAASAGSWARGKREVLKRRPLSGRFSINAPQVGRKKCGSLTFFPRP